MQRLVFSALVLCAGCSASSQLVVGFLTNLTVPAQLTNVEMNVYRDSDVLISQQTWTISDTTGEDFVWPGSFDYYSDHGGTPVLSLELLGYVGTNMTVARRSQLQLLAEKRLFYRMALVSACETAPACATGSTCVEGVCKPDEIDARTLPAYDSALTKELQCDSGSGFIDTGTCHTGTCAPLPITASSCAAGEICSEGTCYTQISSN